MGEIIAPEDHTYSSEGHTQEPPHIPLTNIEPEEEPTAVREASEQRHDGPKNAAR